MRSLKILIVLGILSFAIVCIYAHPFGSAVSVDTVSPSQTNIYFSLPDFEIREATEQGYTFHQIDMPESFSSADKGLPGLPHFTASFAIPIGSTPQLGNVSFSTPRYIQTLPIAPIQNYDNPDHTFDFQADFYQSSDPKLSYPSVSYTLSEVMTMRDYQFVVVKIYPIKYFPEQKTIEVIDSFQINITHHTDNPNPTYTLRPTISKPFEKFYEHTLLNYHQVRSPNPDYQQPSVLLIYGGGTSAHTPTFMTQLNNIINHKKRRGYLINAVSTVITGSSTSTIKAHIQNLYDTDPNPPEWIILLGNKLQQYVIPCYAAFYAGYAGDSDYPYTLLSGDDMIGDAFIGRISVSDENQLGNYWQKIQRYEQYNPTTDYALYKKALLVGHSDHSGVSTYIVNRYIKSLMLDYEPTQNIQEMYYYISQSQTLLANFNAGHAIFNFRGYVGMDGFGSSISNTINTNILTNCVVLTCHTGEFDNPGQTEELIRRTYNNQPAGAILATGISTTATETEYNNAENGGIFYAMYPMDVATMGEAVLFGKIYTTLVYPGNEHTISTIHWTNLMGDPALHFFKTTPKTFATVLPSTFALGTQAFRFNVIDSEGNSVPDASVTIAKIDGSYISKGISDTDGVAFLPLDHTQTGTFIFTISKPGYLPSIETANATETPAISITEFMVYDPAPANNNQHINPGETVNLTIKVKNFLSTNATNLSATISSESEYVSFGGATTATIGSIGAGLESLRDSAFAFTVSPLTPNKILLPLTITITDGSSSWTSHLLPEVLGVDLKVVNMNPSGQSYLNAGIPTSIVFTLRNEGTQASGTLQATLLSRSLYLNTSDQIVTLPNIPINTSIVQDTPFTVDVVGFMIPGSKLKADLRVYNDSGFETMIPVDLPVGSKIVTDPTGPDEYGYVIYHSADSDLDERPIYDWINIASIGTNTSMSDTMADQEEDKKVAMLPFTASFYGVEYDRITICSNGWMIFGETEQKDFRNLPLPGPIAPKALIAPYWTDLVVGGGYGSVYKYYHEEMHAFIVQFDKVRWVTGYGTQNTFSVSNDSVSFQVLIYDPVYNGTALGDSKIKIQYRRFHPGISGDDDNPIQFITVGIQDHTEKRGVQYVYNNVYSPGSNTLENGTALLITQPSFLIEQPYLQIARVYYHPESGGNEVRAGEYTNVGISIVNVGMQTAENVSATLSCDSPYIQVVNDTATYADITSTLSQSNPQYFTIFASSDIPANTSVRATLHISTDGLTEPLIWDRDFYFNVAKPNIQYRSYLVNDASPGGNNDGIVNPAESVKLIVNIANPTSMDVQNMVASISTVSPLVTINSATYAIPKMKPSSVYQTVFDLTIDPNIPMIENIPIVFTTQSQNASGIQREISLGINHGNTIYTEDFDTWYPAGWTINGSMTNWSQSLTTNAGGVSPEIVFAGSATSGTTRFLSPAINTVDINRVLLTFRHKLLITQVTTPTTIGVATRRSISDAWAAVWTQEITADIPATLQTVNFSNTTLGYATTQLCFYITGNLETIENWYIDSLSIQNSFGNTATISGSVVASDTLSNVVGLRVTAGEYSTHVRPDNTYTMYLIPRNYPTLSIVDPYFSGNTHYLVNPTAGEILSDYDFMLYFKAPPDTIWIDAIAGQVGSENRNVTLKWRLIYDHVANPLGFVRFNIYRQINSAQYVLLTTTTATEYSTVINPANIYRFYITSTYASGDSQPSPTKYIDPATMTEEDGPVAGSDTAVAPLTFILQQNYPNPFNPTTNISFSIPTDSHVNVNVYNIKGQLVKTLLSGHVSRGSHTIQWHGDNSLGHSVGSGIYLIRVNDSSHSAVKKALLLK